MSARCSWLSCLIWKLDVHTTLREKMRGSSFARAEADRAEKGKTPTPSSSLLDLEFASTMRRVQAAMHGAPRQLRIRSELWYQRLCALACVRQDEFRRDRNLQAELLLQCIEEGSWTEPLDRHPPEGPLPMLPPHVACALRRKRAERLELAKGMGACRSERAPRSSTAEAAAAAAAAAATASLAALTEPLRAIAGRDRPWLRSSHSRSDLKASPSPRHARQRSSSLGRSPERHQPSLASKAAAAVGPTVEPATLAALAAHVAWLERENRRLKHQLKAQQQEPAAPVPTTAARGAGVGLASFGSRTNRPVQPSTDLAPKLGNSRSGSPARQPTAAFASPVATTVVDGAAIEIREISADVFHGMVAAQKHQEFQVGPCVNAPTTKLRSPAASCQVRTPPRVSWSLGSEGQGASPSKTPPARPMAPGFPTFSPTRCETSGGCRSPTLGPAPPEDDNEGFLRYLDAFQEYAGRLTASVPRLPGS